ncbi:MAG: hypothetical protein BWX73_02450 [Lentisphaerae bacterium ADurb.Bin082]|nr:MAG: hypothetical protein BWX73_02450 [Lentisphaerae bacterium ADurb.Bin082]HQL86189.1 hypothetical protein [Lentisphaeria bacterium]
MSDSKYHKTVIINRAVSGSGKTTLSRCVTDALQAKGLTVTIHSTDEFFMQDGRYVFELDKLNAYHVKNLANFTADLKRGIDVVICDNMNLLPWQSQPYTDAARKYHYRIIFLNFLPRELEKHLAAQVVTEEKPDAHGLSKELLERFIQNFHDYNDLLCRSTVRDIRRHRVFVWNDVDKKAMDTGDLAQYFDADAVVTIHPNEYHDLKQTLADKVLKLLVASNEELKRHTSKKHYLLTWYGITDLRAALGLEPTDGPVLAALRTGNYTDVVILGYTNPNKSEEGFSSALRTEWEKLRVEPLETRLAYPRNKAQVMVDAVCNTEAGHTIFRNFIKEARLSVRVKFVPQVLSHLNDARAIDAAARKALHIALSDEDEKDITCFLSPGTPVMAYTWAMVSRMNPNLNLRVIASSDPRKPPEEIDLPKDLVAPPIIVKPTSAPTAFDVIIHLLGTDTNLPQYFSIVQFPAARHYFITSSESRRAELLRPLLPQSTTMETKIVNAFIPLATRKAVAAIIQSLPPTDRIGVNLTGGTKLMFAGGLNASNEFPNAEPFYFDIKQHNITFIRTGVVLPFKGVTTIDGFFIANGYTVSKAGYWQDKLVREERKELTLKLSSKLQLLGRLYQTQEFRAYKTTYWKPNAPFDFQWRNSRATLKGNKATLLLEGEALAVPDCTDFGDYLGGGWLEEYAYLQLRPFLKKGQIFDLRIGVEVFPAGKQQQPGEMPVGEFDCAFTDGKRLFMVECKAGVVKQEHIQKLENNLKTYGGIAAQGILLHAFPLDPKHKERISSSTSIRAVRVNELATDPNLLENILIPNGRR